MPSLVGSEMCIRDSYCCYYTTAAAAAATAVTATATCYRTQYIDTKHTLKCMHACIMQSGSTTTFQGNRNYSKTTYRALRQHRTERSGGYCTPFCHFIARSHRPAGVWRRPRQTGQIQQSKAIALEGHYLREVRIAPPPLRRNLTRQEKALRRRRVGGVRRWC